MCLLIRSNQFRWLKCTAVISLTGFVLVMMYLGRETQPTGNRTGPTTFLFMFGLLLIKLWLVGGQALWALGAAAHDDLHFIAGAYSIRQMNWLGDYTNLTLIKGPFYPMWIALGSWLDMPLLLSQHLFYTLACALTVVALKPVIPHRLALLALYGILMFNPITYTVEVLRVIREGISPAETLVIVACLIGLHTRRLWSLGSLSLWATGLGLALATFWLTREDGIWLVPTIVVLLGSTVLSLIWSRTPDWIWRVALCGLPLAIWGVLVAIICTMNWATYGIFTTCEFRWSPFVSAYGALARVEHDVWKQYYLLPRETRQRIYEVSPAFRELEPALEGDIGKRWAAIGLESYPGDEDIVGGWLMWALRDAVARAGYYQNASGAAVYYNRLADEVNRACNTGLLRSGPARTTMLPPWRPEYAPLLMKAFWRGMRQLISFYRFNPQPMCSIGTAPALHLFRAVTRERLGPVAESAAGWPSKSDQQKVHILQMIGNVYQEVMPRLAVLATLILLASGGVALARRQLPYYLVLEAALMLGIVLRIGMLAMADISALPGLDILYLTSVFPVLLLGVSLAAVPLGHAIHKFVGTRMKPRPIVSENANLGS
jgi:hypothetical protein